MKAKILGVLMLTFVSVFVFTAIASAQTFRTGQSATIPSNETIDGSAFVSGSAVDIAGKINGDLYCAGQNITISGEVDGDVLCAGQTITLSGTVTGSARLAGQTVAISGDVKGSATTAGQTVTLEGTGKVGRDALLLGQSVNLDGQIARDAVIASNSASVSAGVGRNVTANVETLTLNQGASIAGRLDYTSPNKLTKDAGANVVGKTTYNQQKVEQRQHGGYNIAAVIIWGLMLLVSAIIFVLLFPRELHRATDPALASPAGTFLAIGVGLVAGIVMPIIILLLIITVLGIPFALAVLLAWILILALSGTFAAYFIGRLIWRAQSNAVLIMLAGALVIIILLMIPIVNILVFLLSVWYGTGAIILQLKKLAVAPRYDMRIPKVRSRS